MKTLHFIYLLSKFISLCALFSYSSESSTIDEKKTKIWGPGLKTELNLPVRYFYIQFVDKEGNNVTDISKENLNIQFFNSDSSLLRIYAEILKQIEGYFIVRFRLYKPFKNFGIKLSYNDEILGESPYILRGWIYPEECDCPEPNLEKWLRDMECKPTYRQIEEDLEPFTKINMKQVFKEMKRRFNQPGAQSYVHYAIKNGKIYRRTFGEHVGFKMFMDSTLLSILGKVTLPDFEFIMNLGDWPLENRKQNVLPIVSWCGSDTTSDIVLPTYDLMDSTIESMNRVSLDLLSVQGNMKVPWNEKKNIAFWRGRDSRQERLDLVKLSKKYPKILDAKLTNMFFFKHNKKELGELAKHVPFYDFFKYKYQVTLDGTVAAYRFPYLMAGDGLIFKQESGYYEHFYRDLKPYTHYIPIEKDLSDLLQKIRWAKLHDEESKMIAINASLFTNNFLLAPDLYCYHAVLFKKLSERLNKVEITDDMELVEQAELKAARKKDCCFRKLKDEL